MDQNNLQGRTNYTPSKRILRLPDVKQITGISRSLIYLKISQGTFPSPISLGERSVGWIEDEIIKWIEQCIKQSRQNKEVNL